MPMLNNRLCWSVFLKLNSCGIYSSKYKNTGASKIKIWWRRGIGVGGTSISDSYYVLIEYIYSYDVL